MTLEEFEEIMEDESIKTIIMEIEEDSALAGLNIIAKYLPKKGVCGADHDVIYGACASDLAPHISKEDAIKLKELNWMIEDDYLQSFV